MAARIVRTALGLIVCGVSAVARPASDAQFWTEIDPSFRLTPQLSASALATVRAGNGLYNPTLWGGGAQLDYTAGPWLLSAGLLAVRIRNQVTGSRFTVDLPLVAATRTWTVGRVTITDRNRIEQLQGLPANPYRYRNRLGLDWPLTQPSLVSHIFCSDEIFYDLHQSRWSRNRAQAGIGLPLTSKSELQLYYLWQHDRFSPLRDLNVLGTAVRLRL